MRSNGGNNIKSEVCQRAISDHCMILLKTETKQWGPISFKFENMWLGHKYYFFNKMQQWWQEASVQG